MLFKLFILVRFLSFCFTKIRQLFQITKFILIRLGNLFRVLYPTTRYSVAVQIFVLFPIL
jgi:hypothetical protein